MLQQRVQQMAKKNPLYSFPFSLYLNPFFLACSSVALPILSFSEPISPTVQQNSIDTQLHAVRAQQPSITVNTHFSKQ